MSTEVRRRAEVEPIGAVRSRTQRFEHLGLRARLGSELVGELGKVDHERAAWSHLEAAGTTDDSEAHVMFCRKVE